jgi:methyltransferase (TIGR00027 family)
MDAEIRQSGASPMSPCLRATTVVRSRFVEDKLDLAVRWGVGQYVILGAGLDTFAYRNPYPEGIVHVFEVDHPMTQAWKRGRLKETGIGLPKDLIFAPIDFETETLMERLLDVGYDPDTPTFFSMLGVTPYVTAEAVMATLGSIASAPEGSGIVFDYLIRPDLLTSDQRSFFEAFSQKVASSGDPWQTFFDPGVLKQDLRAMGYGHVEDNGPEAINALYFKNRTDGLRVWQLTHLVNARIGDLEHAGKHAPLGACGRTELAC